jgi:hypothetical protein
MFPLGGAAVHRYCNSDNPITLSERSFLLGPMLSHGTTLIGELPVGRDVAGRG